MSRYRFALKPKWILGHIIVLAMIIGFVNAGLWQIRRMHERQNYNDEIVKNMDAPVAPVGEVLARPSGFDDVAARLNRRVSATGHYLENRDLVINAQASPDGVPGVWIVSPLLLDDGRVFLVNRGWLPSTGPMTAPPSSSRPPAGRVTVTGYISETQPKTEGESAETNDPGQRTFLRIDIARIQQDFSQRLVPAFLLRQDQLPADPGSRPPQNLATPALSTGPHLSYVMQWFGFTLLALVGYPLLLWLIGRDRAREAPGEPDLTELPPGAFVDADGVIDLTRVGAGDTAGTPGIDTPRDP